MIKPINIIDSVADITAKMAQKTSQTITQASQEATELPQASGELLRTYRGVKVKKLFESLPEFLDKFKTKLESFKEDIPEKLLKELEKAADNNNFSLQKIVAEHYSGLNDCHTLEQVKKLYPEIELPNLKFEDEIRNEIKAIVPKSLCDKLEKISSKEEKQKILANFFDRKISKQVEKWEIYPEFKKIQNSVSDEIITGKYTGNANAELNGFTAFNSKMPVRYRLMLTPDREEAYISMLRDHYISGKPITDLSLRISNNMELSGYALRRHGHFPELNKNFRTFIKNSEDSARQFKELASLDTHEINSAIMTQTWRTSGLRRDLGNETAYKKDWSLIKPVWQKTMFPETTFYPTDKLIDTFLIAMFKNGKREAEVANPILKYLENSSMNKNKIMLLKRLYKNSKDLDLDKRIINSEEFKKFKAQFDIDGMAKAIEDIETHYKNAFFKRFWTDDRKLRFTTALNQNREIASQNIEISDKILTDAMNSVFTEV